MSVLPIIAVMAGSLGVALLFRCIRVPLWPMTGGLVGAAAVNLGLDLSIQVPDAVGLIAQFLIGTSIGVIIGPEIFRKFRKFWAPGIVAVMVALGTGLLLGWGFGTSGLMDFPEGMLSLAPGGASEMAVAAVAIGLDGAVVIGAHVVRLFTVVWSLPLVLWAAEKIYQRWNRKSQDEGH